MRLMVFVLFAVALTVVANADAKKTVFAHFYYWYPVNAGIITHHPPDGHFNNMDVNWWKGELRNAQFAGVDVLTLMYWDSHSYNPAALKVLVKATREMDKAGEGHPKIAMHLDGVELTEGAGGQLCDLRERKTQEAVLRCFVRFFRFFKEQKMLDLCFRQDGKLVAFVYRPEYGHCKALAENGMVDYWHEAFQKELGEKLYVVLESSFYNTDYAPSATAMHCTNADNYYRWDAAYSGPLLETRGQFPVATIGPGFDDSGIHSRGPQSRTRDRKVGDTFREAFQKAIEWHPRWLVIETFNFFEEGTDITETKEFGRLYLRIAHEYTAKFKAGKGAAK
jgi:hypothetical protein